MDLLGKLDAIEKRYGSRDLSGGGKRAAATRRAMQLYVAEGRRAHTLSTVTSLSRAGAGQMKLTKTERWILSNQYRILAALYPDETDHFDLAREALENGYESEYESLIPMISDDSSSLSDGEARNVIHIMSMFEALEEAYPHLPPNSGVEEHEITFAGFDR